MTCKIKEFLEADRPSVIALWQRCGLTRPWNDPGTDIDLAVRELNATLLVGMADEAIIASLMVGFDGHRGWVYYLAVEPGWQRKGIGRQMMLAAEDWLKVRDAPKIQLMVRHDNGAALGFYEALGYAVQETTVLGRRLHYSPDKSIVPI
jgi:ribosomal protein S18 acetylase RimI-like enzyme